MFFSMHVIKTFHYNTPVQLYLCVHTRTHTHTNESAHTVKNYPVNMLRTCLLAIVVVCVYRGVQITNYVSNSYI